MTEKQRAITDATLIPLSLLGAIATLIWGAATFVSDTKANAEAIEELQKGQAAVLQMQADVAVIRYKVEAIERLQRNRR